MAERIAVVYDVHGNLAALEAVLAEAEAEGFERIISGGDVAMLGPRPAACIDRLRNYGEGLIAIRGNTDRMIASDEPDATVSWARDAIGAERATWLGALPETAVVTGHDLLVVHATPSSDEDIIDPGTPDDELAAELVGVVRHTVLCGHVHIQYRRMSGAIEVINPGSVGLPFDGDRRAAWAMVRDGVVELRRTAYPVEATIAAVAAADIPRGDWITGVLESASR